ARGPLGAVAGALRSSPLLWVDDGRPVDLGEDAVSQPIRTGGGDDGATVDADHQGQAAVDDQALPGTAALQGLDGLPDGLVVTFIQGDPGLTEALLGVARPAQPPARDLLAEHGLKTPRCAGACGRIRLPRRRPAGRTLHPTGGGAGRGIPGRERAGKTGPRCGHGCTTSFSTSATSSRPKVVPSSSVSSGSPPARLMPLTTPAAPSWRRTVRPSRAMASSRTLPMFRDSTPRAREPMPTAMALSCSSDANWASWATMS